MNLHPIFIHFPIVCLSIYSILEIITMFAPRLHDKLSITKKILLYIGAIGLFISIQTGDQAALTHGKSKLITTHATYAERTYITYLIIVGIYLFKWLSLSNAGRVFFSYKHQTALAKFLTSSYTYIILGLLAIVGFGFLFITGALGGAITHGKATDPIVSWIVTTFVK